ncbi:MAG: flagellar basal-body MS-ring/collar protein FliF [Betaproteobacteria bacterium]|jgi:flagellar basal-body M-ring protein/flagellar hook-basal body protein (fliF)|nr:flagellar basal-body MS-ring/collar protein FliF [Betaproteobacteria bacterium]
MIPITNLAMAELVENASPPSAGSVLTQAWGRLSLGQKMGFGVALAALVAMVVGLWLWGATPDYRVLYGNLSEQDGGAVIDALQQMNVPYKFSEGGGALMVPAAQVHEVRLHLAGQGLPKGGTVGFELMENEKFGTSEFLEQVNYKRALEGELARSVQTLAAVQGARIHLAIPKPTVFVREQELPTASVVLALYPGRVLDAGQVNAIVHLVSSSVPKLTPANVTVVDQNGSLLSSPVNSDKSGLDGEQLKYVHQIERDYRKRIEDILGPVVGNDNVHAQVTADIDFTQSEQTAESYRPNQPPNQAAVVSQQTVESQDINTPGVGGVPGALTNQPPVPAVAPLTAPNAAPNPANPVAGANPTAPGVKLGQPPANQAGVMPPVPNSESKHKETTTNFDVDHTISHTRLPVGVIHRLSVAVILNNHKITDKAGKVSVRPFSDAEKIQMVQLVKGAVGFDDKRGDILSLLNSPFVDQAEKIPELPLWKQPENVALARESLKYLVIAGIALYLLLGVIRPAFRNVNRALNPEPAPLPDALTAEVGGSDGLGDAEGEEVGAGYGADGQAVAVVSPFEGDLTLARQLAMQEPAIVAQVLRQWMHGNE